MTRLGDPYQGLEKRGTTLPRRPCTVALLHKFGPFLADTAGATRRLVFDTYPTPLGLAPGDYDVAGIFLGPTGAPTVLHALP